MKKFLVLLALPLLFPACQTPIQGNGKLRTETHSVADFQKISVGQSFILEVNQNPMQEVKVTADENLHPHLHIYVKDQELVIESKRKIGQHKALLIEVSAPSIVQISASGAAQVTSRGSLRGAELSLHSANTASLELSGTIKLLSTELSGASHIHLDGQCTFLEAELSGSSELHSEEFLSRNAQAQLSGASQAWIRAQNTLEAELSGASQLWYTGSPNIEKSVSGAAKIQKF